MEDEADFEGGAGCAEERVVAVGEESAEQVKSWGHRRRILLVVGGNADVKC